MEILQTSKPSLSRTIAVVAVLSSFVLGHSLVLVAQQVVKAETPAKAPLPVEQLTDAELVQQTVSNYLMEAESEETKDSMQQMDIVIGDVRRVAGIPKERERMLKIAAKGAVDRTLEGWRSAQENQVRQQAMGLTPEIVAQRLASIGSVHVGGESADKNGLWAASLTEVLTPEERTKWTAAEDERRSYRTRALAQMLVAELDRQVGLTLTQCEKIEPLALKALADYLPDMANYVDRNSGIDFRMLLLLLSGVPESDTQAVLTPDQYGKWQMLTADFRGWWQSIEQNHRARMNNGGQNPQVNGGALRINGGGRVIINGGGGVIIKQ